MHPGCTIKRHQTILQAGKVSFSYSTAAVLRSDYVKTQS